jgi:hypothetical protein
LVGYGLNHADYKSDAKFVGKCRMVKQYKTDGKCLQVEFKRVSTKWEDSQKEQSSKAIGEYNANMKKELFYVVSFFFGTY